MQLFSHAARKRKRNSLFLSRPPFRKILACLCLLIATIVDPGTASAQAGAVTIGVLIQGLQGLVRQLESSAQTLLQQGNISLAQQQMVAAGSVGALANQLSEIYKGKLDDTAQKVAIGQTNLADDAVKIISQGQVIEKSTASDIRSTLYQLQGSVNQLINRLPFTGRNPVFYGMLVYDVSSAFPNKGYDLELLGFNFVDSKRGNKAPELSVGGQAIPAANVSVQEDRVQVVLPKSVKDKIGFRQSACFPPAPFTAAMKVFYRTDKKFLLFPIGKDTATTFNAFALAQPDIVSAKVSYSGETRATVDTSATFAQSGSAPSVGCETNSSGAAVANLPAAAREIACTANWVNISNLKNHTASCAVGGTNVTGVGTITGLDKQCVTDFIPGGGLLAGLIGKTLCNCPGGGSATLQISGTYKLSTTSANPFKDDATAPYRFLDAFDVSIPSNTAREVQNITVDIRRPECDKPLDTIAIKLPSDPTIAVSQASQMGLFKAVYRTQRLNVEKAK